MTRRRIRHVPTKTTTTPPPASEADHQVDMQRALRLALADRDRANDAVRLLVEYTGADMNAWSADQLDRHDDLLNQQIIAHQEVERLMRSAGLSAQSR